MSNLKIKFVSWNMISILKIEKENREFGKLKKKKKKKGEVFIKNNK